MNPTVVIANQDIHEAQLVAAALAPAYEAQTVTEREALYTSVDNAVAVVLDTNFSEAQAIDALMEVLARVQVPVVMITPEDQPSCAIEALRCGAAGYLVKTVSYPDLLPTAIQEAIARSRNNDEIKRELTELRKRNAALEQELKITKLRLTQRMPTTPDHPAPVEKSMEDLLAERMRNGSLQLPAYPQIALKLRKLLKLDVGIAEVAQLLSQDAAVSAKLLQMANSAQYGNLRKLESVEGAVSRLGLATACSIAEVVVNRSLYGTRNTAYRKILDEQWEHSVACGYACEAIARLVGHGSPHKLFSLGLLHDTGRLALVQTIAQSDPKGERIDSEEKLISFYAFLRRHNRYCGSVLVKRWGFDQDYVDAARYNFDLTGMDKPTRTVMIVNLANTLVRAIGYGRPLDAPDEVERSPAKGFLFPGDSDLTPVIETVHKGMEHTRQMLV